MNKENFNSVVFEYNNKELIAASENKVFVFNLVKKIPTLILAIHEGSIANVCISPNPLIIYSAGNDKKIRIT